MAKPDSIVSNVNNRINVAYLILYSVMKANGNGNMIISVMKMAYYSMAKIVSILMKKLSMTY